MKEYSRLARNKEGKILESSSAIARRVLEAEHHVDFDNLEILSKSWLDVSVLRGNSLSPPFSSVLADLAAGFEV